MLRVLYSGQAIHLRICTWYYGCMPVHRILIDSHIHLPDTISSRVINTVRGDLYFKNPKGVWVIATYRNRGWTMSAKKLAQIQEQYPDFKAYEKVDGFYLIPRGYWSEVKRLLQQDKVDFEVKNKMVLYERKPYDNTIKLYPHQVSPVEIMSHKSSGILQAPCGSGKSIMTLKLICDWGQPTLVLAHTNQILEQWAEYVEDFTGQSVGLIQGTEFTIKNITVASVMTLAKRELTDEFLEQFGCVVLDEAHHAPAYSFASVLAKFPARIRMGVTATPRREDGLQNYLTAVVGPVRSKVEHEELINSGFNLRPTVHVVPTNFSISGWKEQREEMLYGDIEDDVERAIDVAKVALQNGNRSVLVLSRRIKHLDHIADRIFDIDPNAKMKVLTGRLKKKDRNKIVRQLKKGRLNIVLATQLADEGLDIPRLDVVLLTFPASGQTKIEQQIGRIMRTHPSKKRADIYDFVDVHVPRLFKQAQRRFALYRNLKYPMVKEEIDGT